MIFIAFFYPYSSNDKFYLDIIAELVKLESDVSSDGATTTNQDSNLDYKSESNSDSDSRSESKNPNTTS